MDFVVLVGLCLLLAGGGNADSAGLAEVELTSTNVTKLAFGSCNKEWKPQPLWRRIQASSPDLFLWLGDVVYNDRRISPLVWRPSPLSAMVEKYRLQINHPEYSQFLKSGIPILGIWDDHDYGVNDGGIDYADAEESKKLFLEFIREPAVSVRRHRPGMYTSYLLSSGNGKKVKLILTDVRSQLNHTSGDVLGAKQWKWLEEQLAAGTTEADITVVTSGMQVISDLPTVDKMLRYNNSRERYLKLLSRFPRTVLLSGDVHFAEVNCFKHNHTNGYAVHEMTSSGLTHTCVNWGIPVIDFLCHVTLKLVLQSHYRVSGQVLEKNFAVLQFNWDDGKENLVFQVHNEEGPQLTYKIDLNDLNSKSASCPPVLARPLPIYVFWLGTFTFFSGSILAVVIFIKLLLFVVRRLLFVVRRIFGQPVASSKSSQKQTKKHRKRD